MGREEGGTITLDIYCDNDEMNISIDDDGIGMSQDQVEAIYAKKKIDSREEGIGVRNCIQRLEQIYGPQYKMVIISVEGKGTTISFRYPNCAQPCK